MPIRSPARSFQIEIRTRIDEVKARPLCRSIQSFVCTSDACDSIAPREMTKLTSGRRRRGSNRRLSEAFLAAGLRMGQAFTKTWHLQACGGTW